MVERKEIVGEVAILDQALEDSSSLQLGDGWPRESKNSESTVEERRVEDSC